MPSARKRTLHEVDTDNVDAPKEPSLLHRIRNMWQFANLCQWITLFGNVVKLDDFDIADLEAECLKPHSTALQDIGLALLKFLSSHRGLTHELFDEYTKRQYLAKAPGKNPFGADEEPRRFADFDVFTKICILQQMTQFVMINPDRLREKAEEQRDIDQTNWRIEPYGWDREDRTYFVLDDNRLYRQSEPPAPPARPKKTSKKAKAALRASKRRRISAALASDAEDAREESSADGQPATEPEDDGLGGMKWECVAVTLDEVRQFLATIQKTRDDNEKILRDQIQDHLLPILEKQEESMKRKQLQREKELLNLEKLAHAKRSSRLAGKAEQQKMEEQAREEERKIREQEVAARKEDQKRLKIEKERDRRLMSRAHRLREREARRLQHEEELAQLSEDSKNLGAAAAAGRMSERQLKAEIERKQQALKELTEEDDDWMFDCVCGVHGQIDDGTHSVSCEQCSVWQHSKCLGIAEEEAEKKDFHFVCDSCRRREQAEKERRPRMIKIKVNRPGSSPSSPAQRAPEGNSPPQPNRASQLVVELQSSSSHNAGASLPGELASRDDQAVKENGPNGGSLLPPFPHASGHSLTTALNLTSDPESATTISGTLPHAFAPGANPFSSPHPTLSPPDQSPNKSRAYHTIYDPSSPMTSNGHGVPNMGQQQIKQQQQPLNGGPIPFAVHPEATPKTTPPALFPAGVSAGVPSARDLAPQLTPSQRETGYDEKATPLPPSRGGLSPTKHSPPLSQQQQQQQQLFKQANGANGISPLHGAASSSLTGASPKPTILPPSAALSPSPPQQILTPPVKPAEPPRPAQQQGPPGAIWAPPTSS